MKGGCIFINKVVRLIVRKPKVSHPSYWGGTDLTSSYQICLCFTCRHRLPSTFTIDTPFKKFMIVVLLILHSMTGLAG